MEWDMMDRVDNIMDLDLNLEPLSSPSLVVGPTLGTQLGPPPPPGEALNLEDWVAAGPPLPEPPTIRGRTSRQRYRFRNSRRPVENSIPLHWLVDSEEPVGGPSGAGLAAEDGGGSSIALEGRTEEVGKTCENHVSFCENGSGGEGECAERKTSSEEVSSFDCNICLDSAHEPVVTCCGHLFCWRCIYSWIYIHSHTRECPVCKGEVTDKTLIPIYGRGNHTCKPEEDSCEKIPARPSGNRIENIGQTIQRATSSFTLEEIIHRVGAWFGDIFQPPSNDDGDGAMMYSVLQRILTRRAQNRAENVVEFTQERAETSRHQRLPPLTYRRRQSSVVQSSGQQLPTAGDDRDSFSSVAAVIHGETISTSSSSSRLRNEASRTSDVDSGESRALRRRRLA